MAIPVPTSWIAVAIVPSMSLMNKRAYQLYRGTLSYLFAVAIRLVEPTKKPLCQQNEKKIEVVFS